VYCADCRLPLNKPHQQAAAADDIRLPSSRLESSVRFLMRTLSFSFSFSLRARMGISEGHPLITRFHSLTAEFALQNLKLHYSSLFAFHLSSLSSPQKSEKYSFEETNYNTSPWKTITRIPIPIPTGTTQSPRKITRRTLWHRRWWNKMGS
jgi:hypothetical protein